MSQIAKVLYTAKTRTTGGRDELAPQLSRCMNQPNAVGSSDATVE
jgi:hypothetical protein